MFHSVVKETLSICPAAAVHQDKQGRTPLHLFFRYCTPLSDVTTTINYMVIWKELIQNGPRSAEILDRSGNLPFHYACRYGSTAGALEELIELYPEAGRVADRKCCIPLHVACRRGTLSLDAIISLIAHDNTTIQTADNDNELPLHKACRGGHLAKIQYLLDKFAPASGIRNALGYLPLHILIRKGGKADISMMNTPCVYRNSLQITSGLSRICHGLI